MPAERYFINTDFLPHEFKELSGSEFHHLIHVMRSKKGDAIELINGRGALVQATIKEIARDKATLHIHEIDQAPPSPCRLILAQAFAKQNRLDFILEKGTELGVDEFWLFPGHHSAKKECYPSQLERAQSVTIAAIKQSGRLYLPSLLLKPSIEKWNKSSLPTLFFGDLSLLAPMLGASLKEISSHSFPLTFVTGPEGGFSEQEVNLLRSLGALGVRLHDNILRTETASLMALSLLSHAIASLQNSLT